MAKTSKVIYKPDSQSTDEYTVIVNTEEVSLLPNRIGGSSKLTSPLI
jgi:hypothetical protein